MVEEPTKVNLYPSSDGNRLYVMLTSIGSEPVNLPLIFDSGSAGLSINALSGVFPQGTVTDGGFVFPAGQTTMTYYGITVTSQTAIRSYGGPNGTTQHGNLGFAQVSFGDNSGQITTRAMPVFLYYAVTETANPGHAVAFGPQQGVFGVDPAVSSITITNPAVGAATDDLCSMDSGALCYVSSVLSYVDYGAGVNAGFMLAPAALNCASAAAQCPPQSILTVGITEALKAPFSVVQLVCPPPGYAGPRTINSYAVCARDIADTTLTVASGEQFVGSVIFDTGTPYMQFNVPSGASFPTSVAEGASVMIATPSGFAYNFTAGQPVPRAPHSVVVENNSNSDSVVGVLFFTTNSFFVDYSASTEGWM